METRLRRPSIQGDNARPTFVTGFGESPDLHTFTAFRYDRAVDLTGSGSSTTTSEYGIGESGSPASSSSSTNVSKLPVTSPKPVLTSSTSVKHRRNISESGSPNPINEATPSMRSNSPENLEEPTTLSRPTRKTKPTVKARALAEGGSRLSILFRKTDKQKEGLPTEEAVHHEDGETMPSITVDEPVAETPPSASSVPMKRKCEDHNSSHGSATADVAQHTILGQVENDTKRGNVSQVSTPTAKPFHSPTDSMASDGKDTAQNHVSATTVRKGLSSRRTRDMGTENAFIAMPITSPDDLDYSSPSTLQKTKLTQLTAWPMPEQSIQLIANECKVDQCTPVLAPQDRPKSRNPISPSPASTRSSPATTSSPRRKRPASKSQLGCERRPRASIGAIDEGDDAGKLAAKQPEKRATGGLVSPHASQVGPGKVEDRSEGTTVSNRKHPHRADDSVPAATDLEAAAFAGFDQQNPTFNYEQAGKEHRASPRKTHEASSPSCDLSCLSTSDLLYATAEICADEQDEPRTDEELQQKLASYCTCKNSGKLVEEGVKKPRILKLNVGQKSKDVEARRT